MVELAYFRDAEISEDIAAGTSATPDEEHFGFEASGSGFLVYEVGS